MLLVCPDIGDDNFDHLVMVMSAKFLHSKVFKTKYLCRASANFHLLVVASIDDFLNSSFFRSFVLSFFIFLPKVFITFKNNK